MTPARRTGRTVAERVPTTPAPFPVAPMSTEPNSLRRVSERAALRRRFRDRRRSVDGAQRVVAEAAICESLVTLPTVQRAGRLALYRAFDGEVDLEAVEQRMRQAGRPVVFARTAGADRPLEFVDARGWHVGDNGLPVPRGPRVELSAGDVLVVPGVAFDADGFRLGFGGGYYDRTLARTPAHAIGVCFECQRIEWLPLCPWDRPVRTLITERGAFVLDIQESRE